MMISKEDIPEKLRELRYAMGLTQKQAADAIGVSKSLVSHCERRWEDYCNSPKIFAFLKAQDWDRIEFLKAQKVAEKIKGKHFDFAEGKCYRIFDTRNPKTCAVQKVSSPVGQSWEKEFIFMFLRKDGIHHVFREISGGWIRTYTDAQLIGKKIQEA